MSVILSILKVLGILLLLLLGILLLLMVLILVCPIRYRIEGAKVPSAKEQTLTLKASAKWLLGILGIKYDYPEPGAVKIRFLCFTFYDSLKPSKNKKNRKVSSPKTDTSISSTDHSPTSATEVQASDNEATTETATVTTATANGPKAVQAEEKEAAGKQQRKNDNPGLKEKLMHFYQEYCFYKKFWNARETQELLAKVLNRCKRIMRSVLPSKLDAKLLIGTGEPDTTGYVMAVYGIFFSVLGNRVEITPDFEQQIFEGYFKVQGRICIFTLLRHVLSILLDRNLRIVYNRFKRHKAKIAKEAAESGQSKADSTESEE